MKGKRISYKWKSIVEEVEAYVGLEYHTTMILDMYDFGDMFDTSCSPH
jgi:hypothetical protein